MPSRRERAYHYREGHEAAVRFEDNLSSILHIGKEELARREAAYQQERSTKDRPGPKPGRHRTA